MTPTERPTFAQLPDLLNEIRRTVYAPSEDYYTGDGGVDGACVDETCVDGVDKTMMSGSLPPGYSTSMISHESFGSVDTSDVDVGVGDGASNTIEMTCRRIQEEFGMGLMNDSVFHD